MLPNKEACTKYILEMGANLGLPPQTYNFVYNEQFQKWPASINFHHKYDGGLLHHTAEVTDLCLYNNEYFGNPVDKRLLFLAAIYHDIGKLEDYEPIDDSSVFRDAPHKKLIHHIARSAIVASNYLRNYLTKDEMDQILHAILAHHQLKEWGSPVQPQTKMAWLLHLSDNMSARMADLGTHKWNT